METEQIAKAIADRTGLNVTCLYEPTLKGYCILCIGYVDKTPYSYNEFFKPDYFRAYECLIIAAVSLIATIAFNKRNEKGVIHG